MPTVIATIRSKDQLTFEGEGPDLAALRQELIAKVPDTHEVVSVFGSGKASLTLTARSKETREVRGAAGGYEDAKAAALAEVPEGWAVLSFVVSET